MDAKFFFFFSVDGSCLLLGPTGVVSSALANSKSSLISPCQWFCRSQDSHTHSSRITLRGLSSSDSFLPVNFFFCSLLLFISLAHITIYLFLYFFVLVHHVPPPDETKSNVDTSASQTINTTSATNIPSAQCLCLPSRI
ncbi:hypothetical protein DM01DRAFT_1140319 [Hesseltinella vesiculosa]|uniref:Uncharacterized protein n=1 Tax=Hesseltinella vesiculosa TaxID=101127 RepID=A0A1X2G852_9FUNG|nr:hypothetical protein DM01DRAFT_1140319 [Hesseltinella vesiculosa]